MTDEHIEKTKAAIVSAGNIPADRKAELVDLLSKLKPAIAKVSETHHEDARSIARLVEASAHETIRAEKKPEHTNRLLHELKRSVDNFETSHPELTAFVTKFSAAPRWKHRVRRNVRGPFHSLRSRFKGPGNK